MPGYSIPSVQNEFKAAHQRTLDFLTLARSLRRPDGKAIHVRDMEEIASLCLLRMGLAWESLLEESFLRYLCGARSALGVAPVLIGARAPTLARALTTILAGQKFISWSADTTIKRAKNHFQLGAPSCEPILGIRRNCDTFRVTLAFANGCDPRHIRASTLC